MVTRDAPRAPRIECIMRDTPPAFEAARISQRISEGPRGQLLTFDVSPRWRAQHRSAGQYCEIRLDGHTGFFAIASPPGAERPEFYVQDNGGSSTAMLASPEGTAVELGPPSGPGYALDALLAHHGPLYALATGSGWYGLRSALWALAAAGRTATVFAGFRDPPSVLDSAGQQRLRDRGFVVDVCLSRPPSSWTGRRGYVQHALFGEVDRLDHAWLLACGQPEMQDAARHHAVERGLRPERFLTNY